MDYEALVAALIAERNRRGWSLAQAGKQIGQSKSVLAHWESLRHRPKLEDLDRWAKALGYRLSVDLLPEGQPPATAEPPVALVSAPDADQEHVRRFAHALTAAGERERRILTGVVDVMLDAYEDKPGRKRS